MGGGLYKASKCAKHDSRLTWNVQGRRGSNGTSGAVAEFSASQAAFVDITNASPSTPATILTEQVSAGSFIVTAKSVLSAGTTQPNQFVDLLCGVSDGSASDSSGKGRSGDNPRDERDIRHGHGIHGYRRQLRLAPAP